MTREIEITERVVVSGIEDEATATSKARSLINAGCGRLVASRVVWVEREPEEPADPVLCAGCCSVEVKEEGDRCGECLAALAEDAHERDRDADRAVNECRERSV